jgi:hypothetical protein
VSTEASVNEAGAEGTETDESGTPPSSERPEEEDAPAAEVDDAVEDATEETEAAE